MTRPGFWKHWKGELVRVLFNVRQSTNGPSEGRLEVVYIHCGGDDGDPAAKGRAGTMHTRDEEQFHERVWKDTGKRVEDPSSLSDEDAARTADRFTFAGSWDVLSDEEAGELWDGLHETFTGRQPKP